MVRIRWCRYSSESQRINLNNFLKIEEKALLRGLRVSKIPNFKVKEDNTITSEDINNIKLGNVSLNTLLKKVSSAPAFKTPELNDYLLMLFKETLESISRETSIYLYPDRFKKE